MKYYISLKNWNDGKSTFYNFFNWTIEQHAIQNDRTPGRMTQRAVVDRHLLDYNADIIYIDGTGHIEFDSQEDYIMFVLRWS